MAGLLAIIIQGCASTSMMMNLMPMTQTGQNDIVNQEGVHTVISTKKFLVAVRSLSNTYQTTGRPKLLFTVLNGTFENATFSPENIKITVNDQPVNLVAYNKLLTEANNQQAVTALSGMESSGKSINGENLGAMFHPQGVQSSYKYESDEENEGSNKYLGNIYNVVAVKELQAAERSGNQKDMMAIFKEAAHALSVLTTTILIKSVVVPGAWYGGYIEFENGPYVTKPSKVVVKVTIAGEEHNFVFKNISSSSD